MSKEQKEQNEFFGQSGTSPTKFERSLKPEQYMDPLVLGSPKKFLELWAVDYEVEVLSESNIKYQNFNIDRQDFTNKFLNEYQGKVNRFNSQITRSIERITIPTRDFIHSALDDFFKVQLMVQQDKLRAFLRHNGSDLSELKKLIRALTGKEDNLDIYCLSHFLWQVKRKIYNKEVCDHLMIVLEGPQGCGKSTVVEKLASLNLLEQFTTTKTVIQITDERQWSIFNNHYLIILDEMQGCKRADIETLKSIITQSKITYRPLYTNNNCTIKQNSSFIGTTNHLIEEIILDTTGMRRFYSISCLDKVDWDAVNSISYEEIWRSINEDLKEGYIEKVKDELTLFQSERKHKSSIEEFAIEKDLIPIDSENVQGIKNKTLYDQYKKFCTEFGHNPASATQFGKGLKKLKIEKSRPYIKTKKETIYRISSKADLRTDNELIRNFWTNK